MYELFIYRFSSIAQSLSAKAFDLICIHRKVYNIIIAYLKRET
jgi:hypothetical protein